MLGVDQTYDEHHESDVNDPKQNWRSVKMQVSLPLNGQSVDAQILPTPYRSRIGKKPPRMIIAHRAADGRMELSNGSPFSLP